VPSKGTTDIVNAVRTLLEIVDDYLSINSIKKTFDWEIYERYIARIRRFALGHKTEVMKE
jgi:uncharacterized Fe-S cluster-containing MiaB family protein